MHMAHGKLHKTKTVLVFARCPDVAHVRSCVVDRIPLGSVWDRRPHATPGFHIGRVCRRHVSLIGTVVRLA
jgi:hypothetical protein